MSAEASSTAQLSAMTNRILRFRAGATNSLWRRQAQVPATKSEKPFRKFSVVCVEERPMQLANQISRRTRRGDARPAPEDLRASERLRAQRTPAPQDQALYRCQCGYSFKAEVTTSVGCPHCGTSQAW